MRKNEEYIVECIDDTRLGSGVVKVDNQVVFVPNLMIHEKAKVRIIKVSKNYCFGKVMEFIEKSPYRIESKCEYDRLCGGCQYQHINYDFQCEMKTRQMKDLFTRSLNRDIQVLPTISVNDGYYYRNKAQFPIQVINNEVKMGFYRQHSNDIVPCKECIIQSEEINEVYQFIQKNITISQAKGLRHVFIRASKKTEQVQVVFIGLYNPSLKELTKKIVKQFPNVVSVLFNENKRNDNVILGDTYKVLHGKDYILENCLGNTIQLHFKSFFQVNPDGMEKLYQAAIDQAHLDGSQTCIDMYSGVGTIGLSIAKSSKEVIGVEIVKEAVDNANENARINGITNCTFVCQDATVFAKEMRDLNKNVDVIFVDPPRKGMTEQGIQDISTLNAKTIVYISCNPETLVRDIKLLEMEGYQAKSIQPVDMFSQTTRLECICTLTKEFS